VPLSTHRTKCAHLDAAAVQISTKALKATKFSLGTLDSIKGQVESFLEIRFNNMDLLDIIASTPSNAILQEIVPNA